MNRNIWDYKHRPLTLHELLDEAEHLQRIPQPPSSIYILPPTEVVTDEDSGEEECMTIENLPKSQLLTEADYSEESENVEDEVAYQLAKVPKRSAVTQPIFEDVYSDFDSEDDLPLSTFVAELPKKKKVQFIWDDRDIQDSFANWQPAYTVMENLTPVELFYRFISQDFIDTIVEQSNLYAIHKNLQGDISSDEMRAYIGILILSGYVVYPRRRLYWEVSEDTNNKLVSNALSRNRFTYIMNNIHFKDNNNLDASDKFSKIRPLFEILNRNFKQYAPHCEFHSIDEAMVPYFGRHGCKQYIRGKPIRWGYKFWVGTTRLGYIVWFDPYQGQSAMLPVKYQNFGLGGSVVLQYVDILKQINHVAPYHLFFDNFFTSVSLLSYLKDLGIRGTGTLRDGRTLKCPLTETKVLKKKERGSLEYKTSEDNDVIVCKWNDNNIVTVASNAASIHPVRNVKRFSRKEKHHIYVTQPNIIHVYNENMGGVDRSDQNMSLYRISIRGKKWYFPLFAHCIDMAVQNAWQLHRINYGKLDQLAFRRAVACGILESYNKESRRFSKMSQMHHGSSRYDRLDHLAEFRDKQRRCAVCHKKVQTFCKKCDVALHIKDCFLQYHTCY